MERNNVMKNNTAQNTAAENTPAALNIMGKNSSTEVNNAVKNTATTQHDVEKNTQVENTLVKENFKHSLEDWQETMGELPEVDETGHLLLHHQHHLDDADDAADDAADNYAVDDAEIEDTKCGLGPFKPAWLQVLARKEVYMIVFSVVGLTQGIFFTYMVAVLSTIEKRFKFTSKETGTILAGNDVSQIILSILLGYYGNYGHRPRWVAMGVFFAALSGFLAALPHFIYGPGQEAIAAAAAAGAGPLDTSILLGNLTTPTTKKEEMCHFQPEDVCEEAENSGQSYMGPLVLFFISQFFFGVTLSIFYNLGITYMDDNINKKAYPIYYSLAFMLRIMGPVLGYFVGGKCLSVWIDPSLQPNLTRKDPRWYGAWWIGFLVIGFGLLVTGNFLVLFPRKLPETLRREHKRAVRLAEREQKTGGKRNVEFFSSLAKTKSKEEKPTLRNLLKALKRLFTNKIWVGNLFNTSVYVLGVSGYWNFKPKYLETQFRQSPTTASYYTGLASFVSLVFGTGLGGAVLRWAHPGPRFVTGYNIFITLLTCASYIILSFVGCPRLDVLGPVDGSPPPGCSSECGCSERYSPMCSLDNFTLYYSPCYAGCLTVNTTASPIEYGECQCIENLVTNTSHTPLSLFPDNSYFTNNTDNTDNIAQYKGWGRSGYCPEPCNKFIYYIVIQMVIKTVASTGRVGSNLIHLRSVADEDKGLALGTLNVFLSVFAFIPAPIMMGAIIDSACLVWDNKCGRSGNCWLYDTDKFRLILHLVPADNEKSLQEDEVKALIRALVESEDPQPTSNTPTTSNGASYTHTTTTRSDQDKAKPHTKKEVEARSLLKQQEDNLGDSRCSIGTLKLHCLRVLATKEVYLMVYFLLGLLQGMIYTYGVSLISTIEKVFSLTSREAGVILAGHGLTLALMCVLLPPCGTHVHPPHRPRWMGVGVVTSLTCCLVAVVTHFASVSASVRLQPTKKVRTEVCFSEGSQDGSCQNATGVGEVFVNPVILLFISQFLVGIALSIFYTVGVTYLDDNINKKASPLNYATPLLLKMLVRMVGPVCGFLLGGWCLSLWVVPSPHTNTNDPTRHGPWWIGYLLLACGLLVSCGFLYLCPGKLAGEAVKRKEARQEEAAKKQWWLDEFLVCNRKRKEARRYVHNLPKALKRLFGSKIWVGNLFSSVTFFLAIACYFNFKSKYLETHFGKSASEANFYTGLSTLGASLLAVAATAAFMRWTRPSSRFLASYDVILTLLGCVSYVILMFLSCPQLHILGPLARSEAGECSSECKCSLQFSPVCAEDNTTVFYSACYAGCSAFDLSSESLVYRACRCIGNFSNPFITVPDTLHTVPDTLHTVPGTLHTVSDTFHTVPDTLHTVPDLQRTWGSATPGYCPDTCQVFLWYILVQMLTTTICASGRITNAVVQLRAVPEEDRELSLGILGVCISLFGILPAPIIMGTALDSACLVWENQCGHPGHCNFYDSDKLRIIMHLVPAVFAFASALGDLVVLYYSRKMNLYDDKDNDDYEVPRNDKLA